MERLIKILFLIPIIFTVTLAAQQDCSPGSCCQALITHYQWWLDNYKKGLGAEFNPKDNPSPYSRDPWKTTRLIEQCAREKGLTGGGMCTNLLEHIKYWGNADNAVNRDPLGTSLLIEGGTPGMPNRNCQQQLKEAGVILPGVNQD